MDEEFKLNDLLEFDIYETTVKGKFQRMEGNSIVILTTYDFIKDTIGHEQRINKSYPHKIVKE